MSASVLLDAQPTPQTAPFALSVHLAVTLNVTAEDARRAVNRQVVTELGTGLVARAPELVIAGEQILWRVPIALSLPNLGDLGQVGTVDVDARTGDIVLIPAAQEKIIQHAHRLYAGATLQTK
jgi:hypothetical protein